MLLIQKIFGKSARNLMKITGCMRLLEYTGTVLCGIEIAYRGKGSAIPAGCAVPKSSDVLGLLVSLRCFSVFNLHLIKFVLK